MGARGPPAAGAIAELQRLFAAQRDAFARERYPAYAVRRDRLVRVLRIVTAHEAELCAAVTQDFGHRSTHETRLAELYIVAAECAPRAASPQRAGCGRGASRRRCSFCPGASRILRQPRGVVGVISPWNYPVQLALAPVVGALAAGNRVLLKPSELTPATSALLARAGRALFSRRTSSRS